MTIDGQIKAEKKFDNIKNLIDSNRLIYKFKHEKKDPKYFIESKFIKIV